MFLGKLDHLAKRIGALAFLFFDNFLDFLSLDFLGFFSALLEFFHAAKSVKVFHFTRKKRMTIAADLNMNFRDCRAGYKSVATVAGDFGIIKILWMNIRFHGFILPNLSLLYKRR